MKKGRVVGIYLASLGIAFLIYLSLAVGPPSSASVQNDLALHPTTAYVGLVYLAFACLYSHLSNASISFLAISFFLFVQSSLYYEMFSALFSSFSQTPLEIKVRSLGEYFLAGIASSIAFSGKYCSSSLLGLSIANLAFILVYALNAAVCTYLIGVVDSGRTITLFIFSSTAGLVLGFFKNQGQVQDHLYPSAQTLSYSFVGAALVFALFPCVHMLSVDLTLTLRLSMAYSNTIIAISSATLVTAATSYIIRDKMDPLAFLAGPIAGAVASGCTSELSFSPGIPLFLGLLVGLSTALIFEYYPALVQAGSTFKMEESILASGLIGVIASCSILKYLEDNKFVASSDYGQFNNKLSTQSLAQLVSAAVSLGFGALAGGISAFVVGLSRLDLLEMESSQSDSQRGQLNVDGLIIALQ